jgi:hypothetical protein
MPKPGCSIHGVPRLWLIAAACQGAWLGACRDTTEPSDRGEHASPPTPIASQASPIGKAVLPQMDGFVRSDNAQKNFGTGDSLIIEKVAKKADVARILLAFPQAGIADSVGTDSLVSATLELTIRRAGADWGTTGRPVAAHRMIRGWIETGATWNCANDLNPANNKADCSGNTWSMITTPLPYTASPVAQAVITNGQTGVTSFDVTSDVRAFLRGQAVNQGWLLKLAAESQTGTVVFHSRESASKPRLVLSVLKKGQVPGQAPDTIPAWVYQPQNFDSNTASIQIPFVKNIVVIQFQAGATQAQRQAAVDLVRGTVVGGRSFPASEGYYYVSVSDTARGAGLVAAVGQLESLPQVAVSSYDFRMRPVYRIPNDSAGWDVWHLNHDTLSGGNWNMEAVHAPMAWGCETGSSSTRVGVVDGFDTMPPPADLSHLSVFRIAAVPRIADRRHGIEVASVLGATGNNHSGITGVMWDAEIDGYEIGDPTLFRIVARVKDAGLSGAPVINLSWASVLGTSAEALFRTEVALSRALQDLRIGGHLPLLVLAAGNDNGPADSNAFARAKAGPDGTHVIVVGAADTNSHLSSFSDYGSLVEIVAPGSHVEVLEPNGSRRTVSGTSYAAPVVSGIAGLLMSFDPRLTGPELKQIILAAADSGGWNLTGPDGLYPMANAYWALRIAAQRPGAPLCANRLWSDGTHIQVGRSGGDEPIFAFNEPQYGVMELAAHHGGRRIDFLRTQNGQKRAITLSSTQWFENPGILGDTGSVTGVWRSLYGMSHDGSESVFYDTQAFEAGTFMLKWFNGTSVVAFPSGSLTLPPPEKPDSGCAWKQLQVSDGDYRCVPLQTSFEQRIPYNTFSPLGDLAVGSVSVWKTTVTINGDFSPCPWSQIDSTYHKDTDLCAESMTSDLEPIRADVYVFHKNAGVNPLFSLTGSVVQTLEMTEDGTQLIVQEGLEARRSTTRPGGEHCQGTTDWCDSDPEQVTPVGCKITYRAIKTGAILPPITPTRQACINGGIGSASNSIGAIGKSSLKVPSFMRAPLYHRSR